MNEAKKKRRKILARLDQLHIREQNGEDVAAELLPCGRKLDNLAAKPKPVKTKEPVKMNRELIGIAQSNGISYSTLQSRIYTGGWEPMIAATFPVMKRQDINESGLTVSHYRILRNDGLTDRQIIEKFEISQHVFQKFKRKHGLSRTYKKGANKLMDILHKIQDAQSIEALNDLREEIHLAATYNEIDFKVVKKAFMEKKAELEGKVSKHELNWLK